MTSETAAPAAPAARGDALSFVSCTPQPGRLRDAALRIVALLAVGYGVYFEAWRWTHALNPDALWLSVPLALAESWIVVTLGLMLFETWRLRQRSPRPAPDLLDVDVFITTYDEPADIIRRTAIAARDIRYPHRTWILDDGRRFEVRAIARELGIGYRTRPDNTHAKAGNLNAALRGTTGEFILQLDADHVPLPHILDRLLGYFDDPRIAFVQSPQSFYNLDAFGTHVEPETRRLLTDQAPFFGVLQPGKDAREAAFFCGSCGVLRRAAIEELGGFSTETITEDIETSLRLHARGWRSVYHNEPLAFGLAPRTATAFQIQRLRWARGALQLLRKFNPLTHAGLRLSQRICYLASVLHPLEGVVRLVFIITPLLYLTLGIPPVRSDGAGFLLRFLPFLGALLVAHRLLLRGTAGPLWFTDTGSMARFFIYIAALPAVLTRRRLRFRVTPKGLNGVSWVSYAPQAAVVALSLLAIVWSVVAAGRGWVHYHAAGGSMAPYLLNVGWVSWNMAVAALVLRASIRSHQRRPDHRFEDFTPVTFRLEGEDGDAAERAGLTENLTPRGLALRTVRPLPVGARLSAVLPLVTGHVAIAGEVVYRRTDRVDRIVYHRHGVRLDPLDTADADAIDSHCTQYSAPTMKARYVERDGGLAQLRRFFRDARGERRQPVLLPAWVRRAGVQEDAAAPLIGVLEDASRSGARLLLDWPLATGLLIRYGVADTTLRGTARVVRCTELPTPFGSRWMVGVRRCADEPASFPTHTNRRRTMIRTAAVFAGLLAAVRRVMPLALLPLLLAADVHGQLSAGLLSGAERDSEGQSFYLAGAWIGRAGLGLNPTAGVIGYRLAQPDGGTVLWAANPFLGLRHQAVRTGVQAGIGYSFRQESDAAAVAGSSRRVSSGVTTTAQADHSGEALTGSAIASYAWGDGGYLWSRLRAAHRVLQPGGRPLRLGAELTAQGGGGFRAYEAGPVIEWAAGRGLQLVVGGGVRRSELDGADADDLGYFRLELLYIR